MADLPSIANRLNDIEVSANAGLTEALFRKFGSSVNFLFDFLGVTDGETDTSGDLSDFIQAINTIRNDTVTLQFTIPGNGTHTVGTFNTQPFVDLVFFTTDRAPSLGASSGSRDVYQHSVDGGPFTVPGGSITTPASTTTSVGTAITALDGGTSENQFTDAASLDGTDVNDPANRIALDAVLGVTGFEHKMRNTAIQRMFTLSWRDGAQHTVRVYTEGGAGNQIYLGRKLNLESAPLTF